MITSIYIYSVTFQICYVVFACIFSILLVFVFSFTS
nr:MAG TPA: hypothetical protein [Crassvirales sp.]